MAPGEVAGHAELRRTARAYFAAGLKSVGPDAGEARIFSPPKLPNSTTPDSFSGSVALRPSRASSFSWVAGSQRADIQRRVEGGRHPYAAGPESVRLRAALNENGEAVRGTVRGLGKERSSRRSPTLGTVSNTGTRFSAAISYTPWAAQSASLMAAPDALLRQTVIVEGIKDVGDMILSGLCIHSARTSICSSTGRARRVVRVGDGH